jgi:hypothetical protein
MIADSELLARFVTYRAWVCANNTLRQDAFVPHPYPDLSVTRHRGMTEQEIWTAGRRITQSRNPPVTLYGSGDLSAGQVRQARLNVEPRPVPENPNHAAILGWPEKPMQKSYAQELAAVAKYVPVSD